MGHPRQAALAAGVVVVLAAFGVWLIARGGTGSDSSPRLADARLERPFFAPTSFWNRALPDDLAPRKHSSRYVRDLVEQVDAEGAWINTDEYSVPIYTVGPDQRRVRVRLTETDGPVNAHLKAAVAAVPIPSDAHPSTGTDSQLVVWQPSTDKMWEFWEMHRSRGHWEAAAAGAMRNVSDNPGYFDQRAWPGAETWWGATATALPLAGGLIRIAELEAGRIDHALALAIPEAASSHVWPAQRSDGGGGAGAIPEGTTFRLPAKLDLGDLGLPPVGREIAEAAQRYGIVLRDGSADVTFYAEDPTPSGADYDRLFEGRSPASILANFPWSKLIAVRQPRGG